MDSIGRYQLVEKIGQGGMGVVYKAFDTLLQRVVAVKVISENIETGPEPRERFFREARAAGQLSHRNIITIHDLGEHEGHPYLAMEYLEGEDLQRRLYGPDRMSLTRKVELIIQVCEGLEYAHARGVVHRDIKPANVFITGGGTAKILDFGLARLVTSELTNSNKIVGTINYMSPEQVRGERADHRSDIFSAGVVFYELLGGRKAFEAESFAATLFKILQQEPEPLATIDPGLPPDLVAIVERALAKPRDERYQQMADMLRDLAVHRQQLIASGRPLSGGHGRGPDQTSSRPLSDSGPPSTAPTMVAGASVDATVPVGSGRVPSAPWTPAQGTARPAEAQRSPDQRAPRSARWTWLAAAAAALAVAVVVIWAMRASPRPEPSSSVASTPAPVAPAAVDPNATRAAQALEAERAAEAQRQVVARIRQRDADDARTRTGQARAAARGAGAARLAASSYNAAIGAERTAERMYDAGHLAEATAKFHEASGLFQSAEISAQSEAASRAETARAKTDRAASERMPAQPAEATTPGDGIPPPPASPDPQPAAPAARATDPLPTAPRPAPVTLPKAAPAPALPPSQPPAERLIADLLASYKTALEGRDLTALKRLWPGLAGSQEAALRSEFQHASRIEVDVASPRIQVTGGEATATFLRRYQLVTTDGQRLASESRTTMRLRRTDAGWVIEGVRFEPLR